VNARNGSTLAFQELSAAALVRAVFAAWRLQARTLSAARESSASAFEARAAADRLHRALDAWRLHAGASAEVAASSVRAFTARAIAARLRTACGAWQLLAARNVCGRFEAALAVAAERQRRLLCGAVAGWRVRVRLLKDREAARRERQR
jgi:hypothetical protein